MLATSTTCLAWPQVVGQLGCQREWLGTLAGAEHIDYVGPHRTSKPESVAATNCEQQVGIACGMRSASATSCGLDEHVWAAMSVCRAFAKVSCGLLSYEGWSAGSAIVKNSWRWQSGAAWKFQDAPGPDTEPGWQLDPPAPNVCAR